MKPKLLRVLEQCIDTGVNIGWNRSHKHTDTPSEEQIKDSIITAIENELFEWFDFENHN